MTGGYAAGFGPRRRWIWIIVAIVTALATVLSVGLRVWLKADMQHRADPLVTYRQQITSLHVSGPVASVSVQSGKPGRVTVLSTLSWVFAKPVVSERWHGRALSVAVRCPAPDLFEDCAATLAITVPHGVAVRADVGSGDISVLGLSGPLHLATTSGSITLDSVSGPVWVAAASGSISGQQGLASSRLDAVTGSGAVALNFDVAPRLLYLAVGSGAAQVTVPHGSRYRVLRPDGPGALSIAPGLTDPHSARVIRARVGSGSLSVSYPGSGAG